MEKDNLPQIPPLIDILNAVKNIPARKPALPKNHPYQKLIDDLKTKYSIDELAEMTGTLIYESLQNNPREIKTTCPVRKAEKESPDITIILPAPSDKKAAKTRRNEIVCDHIYQGTCYISRNRCPYTSL